MTYFVRHALGGTEADVGFERFPDLILAAERAPEGFRSVAIVHAETQWCLTIALDGWVYFENLDDHALRPRHLYGLRPPEVLRLMELVAQGKIASVNEWPWRPGYGSPTD